MFQIPLIIFVHVLHFLVSSMFRDVFVHEADDKTNNVTCIQVE